MRLAVILVSVACIGAASSCEIKTVSHDVTCETLFGTIHLADPGEACDGDELCALFFERVDALYLLDVCLEMNATRTERNQP